MLADPNPKKRHRLGDLVRLKATGEQGQITSVQSSPFQQSPRWIYWVSVQGQRAVPVWAEELDPIRNPTKADRRG